MSTLNKLRLTGRQYGELRRHLFPGDGLEAVALVACGRMQAGEVRALMARELLLIPHSQCHRTTSEVTWPPPLALPLIQRAVERDLAIVKIHSHPAGYERFSDRDDASDRDLFASVGGWADSDNPHASAIMLECGRILARLVNADGVFSPIEMTAVAGSDLKFWCAANVTTASVFAQRHRQLFGSETSDRLQRLSVAVVGCSGTGSPLIEMLARLGVGHLVLVDPDRVEVKNLNRIYNATQEDAILGRFKTEVMGRAIARMGLGTAVTLINEDLATAKAVRAVAGCDVVFGCMDGARGRNLLNEIATFYCVPYFDVGVRLDADGVGGIADAIGAVHCVQPDGSTLLERGAITAEQLHAEALRYSDPDEYRRQVRSRYIRGVHENRPAVISINTQMAATAVNEFLARLHPYRLSENDEFAVVRTSFVQGEQYHSEEEVPPREAHRRNLGRGDCDPLLDMPLLSE